MKLLCFLSGLINPEFQLLLKNDRALLWRILQVDGSAERQEMSLHSLNPRKEVLHLGPGTLTTVEQREE